MVKFSRTRKNATQKKSRQREADRMARLRAKYVAPVLAADSLHRLHSETHDGEVEEVEHEPAAHQTLEDDVEPWDGGWQEAMEPTEEAEETGNSSHPERVRVRGMVLQLGEEHTPEVLAPEVPVTHVDADDVAKFFVTLQAKRNVSQAVMRDIIDFLRKNDVSDVLKQKKLPSFKTMRREAVAKLPKVMVDVECTNKHGESVMLASRAQYPRKEIGKKELSVKYSLYTVSLKDVWKWHIRAHPGREQETLSKTFDFSLDGVPESRSSGLSIDVLSIRFVDCRNIYTLSIFHPAKKRLGNKDAIVLRPLLEGLAETDLRLRYVIADAPKRASLQGLKSHAATAGCPYCFARKVNKHWPSSTSGGRPRTDEEIRRKAEEIAEGILDDGEGIKGISPLVDVPGLDLINDVPAEAMHLIFLGVTRKMIKMMYKHSNSKKYNLRYRRASDAMLNSGLGATKALDGFSRRPRDLDVAVYKAEEYKNLLVAYWPTVMLSCPRETIRIWLLTVFIVRAMSQPDSCYNRLREKYDFEELLVDWYEAYEETFGAEQCTYNTHCFHHLKLVRDLGPFCVTTAKHYEDHYAVLKLNYTSGTTATGTQALTSLMLGQTAGHACFRRRQITEKNSAKVEDRYVYLKEGKVVFVTNLLDHSLFRARVVPTHSGVRGLLPGVDFTDVLVFKIEPDRLGEEVTARASDVLGKCVVCYEYCSVMTWSMMDM